MATVEEALLTVEESREIEALRQKVRSVLRVARLAGLGGTELYRLLNGWAIGLERSLNANREARQASDDEWRSREDANRKAEAARDANREAERERAVEWLRAKLGTGTVKRTEVLNDAERAGIDLRGAVAVAGVRSIAGAFVKGSLSPNASAEFWFIGPSRPGIDRPAKV